MRAVGLTVLCVQSLSCVQLFVILWAVAHQAPQPIEYSMQKYWSRLPIPTPQNLHNPETKPVSPALQPDTLLSEPADAHYPIQAAL